MIRALLVLIFLFAIPALASGPCDELLSARVHLQQKWVGGQISEATYRLENRILDEKLTALEEKLGHDLVASPSSSQTGSVKQSERKPEPELGFFKSWSYKKPNMPDISYGTILDEDSKFLVKHKSNEDFDIIYSAPFDKPLNELPLRPAHQEFNPVVSPRSKWAISADLNKTESEIKVHSLTHAYEYRLEDENGEPLRVNNSPFHNINHQFVFSSDGQHILWRKVDMGIYVWRGQETSPIFFDSTALTGRPETAEFTADGKSIIYKNRSNKGLGIIDLYERIPRELVSVDDARPGIVYSGIGQFHDKIVHLDSADSDLIWYTHMGSGPVRLVALNLKTKTREVDMHLDEHESSQGIGFHPQGYYFWAIMGEIMSDYTDLRIWDLTSRQLVILPKELTDMIIGNKENVIDLGFSAGGNYFYVVTTKEVRVFDFSTPGNIEVVD